MVKREKRIYLKPAARRWRPLLLQILTSLQRDNADFHACFMSSVIFSSAVSRRETQFQPPVAGSTCVYTRLLLFGCDTERYWLYVQEEVRRSAIALKGKNPNFTVCSTRLTKIHSPLAYFNPLKPLRYHSIRLAVSHWMDT